jgi:hypothetical protein
MAWFRPGEKTRFWVFVVALNFSLKIVLCLFSPFQCIWLEVHLYRKSLHVLFKEILQ